MQQFLKQFKHLSQSRDVYFAMAIGLTDWLFFSHTDPHDVASVWLMFGFLLFSLTVYQLVLGVSYALRFYGLKLKHPHRLSAIIAAIVSGLEALQSIGELSLRDIAVLVPLGMIVYLYFSYGRKSAKNDE